MPNKIYEYKIDDLNKNRLHRFLLSWILMVIIFELISYNINGYIVISNFIHQIINSITQLKYNFDLHFNEVLLMTLYTSCFMFIVTDRYTILSIEIYDNNTMIISAKNSLNIAVDYVLNLNSCHIRTTLFTCIGTGYSYNFVFYYNSKYILAGKIDDKNFDNFIQTNYPNTYYDPLEFGNYRVRRKRSQVMSQEQIELIKKQRPPTFPS